MRLAINGGIPAVPKGTLQNEFAAWYGNKHCLALTSGTAALHSAVVGCGLSAGDEVITPAYSWTSSASCIPHANCIPIFVDIEPVSCNIDPSRIEEAITTSTNAILAVHLHGIPCDMDAIADIARRSGGVSGFERSGNPETAERIEGRWR